MRVGLIIEPTGAHLGQYFGSLRDIPEVKSVAVLDQTGGTKGQVEEALSGKLDRFDEDAESLLAEPPELVIVSLEAHHAPPVIESCLKAGCHVLAEKPACVNVEQFEQLARVAQDAGRQLLLAFANRSGSMFKEARRVVAEGRLGSLYGVQCHTIADQARVQNQRGGPNWFFQKDKGGGGHLIWLGVHAIDWIHYVCGTDIVEVSAFAGNVGGVPVDVEDSAALSFRCANGMHGSLASSYYLPSGKQISTSIWGERGWMWLRPDNESKLVWQECGGGQGAAEPQTIDCETKENVYALFIRSAVRAVLGEEPFLLTTEESLQAIRVVFAAYESADARKHVAIAERGVN